MNWIKRNDITVFLVLAFGLSWWTWPIHLVNPSSLALIPWGPLFAALIVLGLTRGRSGVKKLLADMLRVRAGIGWYALAILLPVAITTAAVVLNSALTANGETAASPGIFRLEDLPTLAVQFLITTLIAGPFTEEPGWRGFLLPRLQSRLSPLAASLIVGVIWWGWHLPVMVSDPTGQRPPLQFLATILAYSVLFTLLYNHTRASVFLVILMHGVTNTMAAYLFRDLLGSPSYAQLWWVYTGLWWAAALTAAFVFRKRAARITLAPVKPELPENRITA